MWRLESVEVLQTAVPSDDLRLDRNIDVPCVRVSPVWWVSLGQEPSTHPATCSLLPWEMGGHGQDRNLSASPSSSHFFPLLYCMSSPQAAVLQKYLSVPARVLHDPQGTFAPGPASPPLTLGFPLLFFLYSLTWHLSGMFCLFWNTFSQRHHRLSCGLQWLYCRDGSNHV